MHNRCPTRLAAGLFGLAACLTAAGCVTRPVSMLYDDAPAVLSGQATVDIPSLITVTAVDGHRPLRAQPASLLPARRALFLEPGEHVIEAVYENVYETSPGSYARFASNPERIAFEVEPNRGYRLTYASPWSQPGDVHPSSRKLVMRVEPTNEAPLSKPAPDASTTATSEAPAESAMPMLDRWWESASPAERDAFLNRVQRERDGAQ
jgi:hypothetical protein